MIYYCKARIPKDNEVALRAVRDAYDCPDLLHSIQNSVNNFSIERRLITPTATRSADSNRTPSPKASSDRPGLIQPRTNKPAVSLTKDKRFVQRTNEKEPVKKNNHQKRPVQGPPVRPKVGPVLKEVPTVSQGLKKKPAVAKLKEPIKKMPLVMKENFKPVVHQAAAKKNEVRGVGAPRTGTGQRQSERAQIAQEKFLKRHAAARDARKDGRS